MYVAQEVDQVIGHVDEEQRHHGIKLTVAGKHLQEITLDELDGLIRPVVGHRQGGVARRRIGLMRPLGCEGLQGVLVQ